MMKCVQQPLMDLRIHHGPLKLLSVVDFEKIQKNGPMTFFFEGLKKSPQLLSLVFYDFNFHFVP